MKKSIFAGVLLGLLALAPLTSGAYAVEDGQDQGSLSTARGNFYIAGAAPQVSLPVAGDLFIAGGNLSVEASTTKDLFAAGGNIAVRAAVGDDARIAGGSLVLSSRVGGDLMMGGGQIRLDNNSSVGGEAFLAGGEVKVDGTITGASMITAESVTINGTLTGNTEIRAASLTFGPTAVVTGSVKYTGPIEARVMDGARVGAIDYSKASTGADAKKGAKFLPLVWVFKLLTMLAGALVLYFIFERKNFEPVVNRSFWFDVLRGLVLLIVIPVAVVLLLVSIVGIWIGLAGILLYALFMIIACGYTGIIAGRLLNQWIFHRQMNWWLVALGVLALEILQLIPVIGWIPCFLLFLAAFGYVFNRLYRTVKA